MSFEGLKKSLDQLRGVNQSPATKVKHGNVTFHVRDLDSEEEVLANEYAYAQVEEAQSGNRGNFSRSMRAAYYYRLAYVALAIRQIDFLEGDQIREWIVDVGPNGMIQVENESVGKFHYLLDLVRGWGKDLPFTIYESLNGMRQRQQRLVDSQVQVEEVDSVPERQEEDDDFRKLKDDEEENADS